MIKKIGTWAVMVHQSKSSGYSKRSGFDNIQIDGNYQKGVKFTMYTNIVNILFFAKGSLSACKFVRKLLIFKQSILHC